MDMLIKYCDKTIFSIEKDSDGKKVVHFLGYGYCTGDDIEKPYRFVEYTFAFVDLNKVIEDGFAESENYIAEFVKQYIGDCSAEELVNIYKDYMTADGKFVSEITEDMDYGLYLYVG